MSASEGLFFLGLVGWIICLTLTLVSIVLTAVSTEPNSGVSDAGQLIVTIFLMGLVAFSIVELTAMSDHVRWVG